VTDREGTIWEANRAAAALLGTEQKFLVRKPLSLFIGEEQRRAFRSRLLELQRQEGVQEWELQLRRRGGEFVAAAVRVAPMRAPEGWLLGLRWSLHDVTARNQIEARTRNLNAELERGIRERTHQLDDLLHQEQTAR